MTGPIQDPERRARRTDAEWNRLRGRIEAASHDRIPGRDWRPYTIGLIAAAAVVFAIVTSTGRLKEVAPEWRVVTTAAGGLTTLRLEDSSVVVLGPASRLRYALSESRRDVELEGLADFTVTHDEHRPFAVRAKNAIASDLGTQFSVRAYGTDARVMVAVASGRVSLVGDSGAVDLRAGEVGYVDPSGAAGRDARSDMLANTAWREGQLSFMNAPLADVVAELGRWFDVEVKLSDSALARLRVTALYATPTLDGVLEALTTTQGARYQRVGRIVTISPRPR